MKIEIKNLLKTLGIHDFMYVENIDDHYEGFYYNPSPETLIRIMYSLGNNNVYDCYISVDRFKILTYNKSVTYKTVLCGRVLLTDSGEFDSDFYAKILLNIDIF